MTEQTVSTRLTLDASDLRAEMEASGQVADDLAGKITSAGSDIEATFSGLADSVDEAGTHVNDLDAQLAGLTDADRVVLLQAETTDAEDSIARIDGMLSDPTLTEAQIDVLVDERNEASEKLEELRGAMSDLGATAEEVNSSAVGLWDDHSTAITGTGVALAGAGAALEAFNRSQQDTRFVAARVATATGLQTDEVIGLATQVHDATRDLGEMVNMMEIGRQQGLRSGEELQNYALFWDTVGDATGETAERLAESSSALRALGIEVGHESDALGAFGFVAQETTSSVDQFLQFISRLGPDLRDMGLNINQVAGLLGAMEQELGLSGRAARTEFRTAVSESDGTLQGLLATLGLSEAQLETYTAKVAASSEVIGANALAYKDTLTPLQEIQARLDALALEFSGVTAAAEGLAPVLIGGGGLIVALNQLRQLSPKAARGMSSLSGNLGRLAKNAGAVAVIGIAVERTINAWTNEMAEANEEASALARTLIGDFDPSKASMNDMHDEIIRLNGAIGELDAHHDEAVNPFLRARYAETSDQLGATRDALLETEAAAAQLQIELGVSSDEALRMATNSDIMAAATENSVGGLDAQAAAAEADAQAQDELEAAIRGVIDANRAAIDPFFAAIDALHSHEDAQKAVTDAEWAVVEATVARDKAIKEHGRKSDEATDAAWDLVAAEDGLEDAQRDVVRSAQDVSGATFELKRMMEDSGLSVDAAKVQLAKWVDQGHITEEQAAQTARELGIVAYNAALSDGIEIMIPVGMDKSDFDAKFASLKGQLASLDSDAINVLIERDAALAGRRIVGHAGGVVPGPVGQEQVITALGGEILINPYDDGSNVSIGMDPFSSIAGQPKAHRGEPFAANVHAAPSGGGTTVFAPQIHVRGVADTPAGLVRLVQRGMKDASRLTAGAQ